MRGRIADNNADRSNISFVSRTRYLALDFNTEVLTSAEEILEAALGVQAETSALLDDIASLWHLDALLGAAAVDSADFLY